MSVGVDVVELARVERALARWGGRFLARLLTDDEAAWCRTHPVLRVAACLAVKESTVKALGGRPPGFRWQDIELRATAHGEPPHLLADLGRELVAATGLAGVEAAPCVVRLRNDRAWAAWGASERLLFAVVIVDVDRPGAVS